MIKKIEDLGVKELVELSDKNWEWVSEKERLSECFIRKYFDFLDVVRICIFQDLSESFTVSYTHLTLPTNSLV